MSIDGVHNVQTTITLAHAWMEAVGEASAIDEEPWRPWSSESIDAGGSPWGASIREYFQNRHS